MKRIILTLTLVFVSFFAFAQTWYILPSTSGYSPFSSGSSFGACESTPSAFNCNWDAATCTGTLGCTITWYLIFPGTSTGTPWVSFPFVPTLPFGTEVLPSSYLNIPIGHWGIYCEFTSDPSCGSGTTVTSGITYFNVYPTSLVVTGTATPNPVCDGSTVTLSTDLDFSSYASTYSASWEPYGGSIVATSYSYALTAATSTTTYTFRTTDPIGCASAVTDVSFTVVPTTTAYWSGAVSTDWNTTGNWICSIIPTSTMDVFIPASGVPNYPEIVPSGTATGACQNIILEGPGASLTINAGSTLQVSGNLSLNGGSILNMDPTATIEMNGTSAQTIISQGGIGNSSGFEMHNISNLEINNSAGVSISSSSSDDSIGITNTLTPTAGTLTTNGKLILASGSGYTGRIAAIPSTGASISGTVTSEQYFPHGRRAWRFLGHPFDNALSGGIGQIGYRVDITGYGGTSHGFTHTATDSPSVKKYVTSDGDSYNPNDPGWTSFWQANGSSFTISSRTFTNTFDRYMGIRFMVRGAKGEGLGYDLTSYSPAILRMAGSINYGNLSIPITATTATSTYTGHVGDPNAQTYNMVANPYPSPTDVGAVLHSAYSSTLYGNFFYVWRPYRNTAGQYQTINYTTSGFHYVIPANSCFQVRCAPPGSGSTVTRYLNFTESDKSTYSAINNNPNDSTPGTTSSTGGEALQREELLPNVFTQLLVLGAAGNLWDELYINFNDQASNKVDRDFDASKLMGPDFNLFSISSDKHPLTYDYRPFSDGAVIPLGMNGSTAQQLTIVANNVAVPEGKALYLNDKFLNKLILLRPGTQYTFDFPKDGQGQSDRFELNMMQSDINSVICGIESSLLPNPAHQNVSISFRAPVADKTTIQLIDATGKTILTREAGNVESGNINLNVNSLSEGMYLIEIASGKYKTTQRLIKE